MKLFPAKCMSGQHCESYDVKREKVHCYPVNSSLLTAVARDGWNLSAVFKLWFCFVLLYNKSLNDWSLGEQWILFPSNLNVSLDFVSGNIEFLGKQNSLFPSGPVIKCLMCIICPQRNGIARSKKAGKYVWIRNKQTSILTPELRRLNQGTKTAGKFHYA